MYTAFKELSNNQVAGIDIRYIENNQLIAVVAVGDHWVDVQWFLDNLDESPLFLRSTGNCGLEALKFFKNSIMDFVRNYMEAETKLLLIADDYKRHCAYRFLVRYGFFEVDTEEEGSYYEYQKTWVSPKVDLDVLANGPWNRSFIK